MAETLYSCVFSELAWACVRAGGA